MRHQLKKRTKVFAAAAASGRGACGDGSRMHVKNKRS